MAFGLFTGPLYDHGYLRPLVLTVSFLTVFGLAMTSIPRSYYQFLHAQGVRMSFDTGFTSYRCSRNSIYSRNISLSAVTVSGGA